MEGSDRGLESSRELVKQALSLAAIADFLVGVDRHPIHQNKARLVKKPVPGHPEQELGTHCSLVSAL